MTEAVKDRITLRGIAYTDETEICLTVSYRDYKKLKKAAKSKYKISMIKEGGAAFLFRSLLKKKLFLAGIGIFVLIAGWQSLFIKEIDIVGCRHVPEEELRAFLRRENLYEGCLKGFDCDDIERKLFKNFPEVVWARVAYDGNFVRVEIAETEKPMPEEKDRSFFCDIVAKKDCYIEEILPYNGESACEKNDFVKKGDMLISGRIPYESTAYESGPEGAREYYVHAEGKVTGLIPYYFAFYIEPGGGRNSAESALDLWIEENVPKNAQILKKDLNFDEKKNIIRVYGTVVAREDVGEEKEIVIDGS